MRKKKVEEWEVIHIRAKGQYLRRVKAEDKEDARKAAAKDSSCAQAKSVS